MEAGLDLYRVLNVPRSASPEEIRSAFRASARRAHPDRGGSALAFQEVKDAYWVLSDAERRARYDQTGQAQRQLPDNRHAQAMAVIASALQSCMISVVERSLSATSVDVLSTATRAAEKEKEQCDRLLRMLADLKKASRAAAGRFTRKSHDEGGKDDDGQNLLQQIMASNLRDLELQEARERQKLAILELALDLLKDYAFRTDKNAKNCFTYVMGTSASTITSSTT